MSQPGQTPAPEATRGFAVRLSEAITHRNLTLERLSSHLRQAGTPVSIATLSYWQSGRSVPTRARSLAAVDELERLLGLPVGHLAAALPGEQPPPPGDDAATLLAALDPGTRALVDMGLDPHQPHPVHWIHDHVTTSADADRQTERTRQLLESHRDGLDRIPVAFRQSSAAAGPARMVTGAGCELGRVVHLPEHQTLAAELLLPRPLRRGELWMVEYQVAWDVAGETSHGFTRTHRGPVRYHVLQASFEGRPPVRASYATTPLPAPGGTPTTRHQPVPAGPLVQIALTDPAPGSHGLSWEYPPREDA